MPVRKTKNGKWAYVMHVRRVRNTKGEAQAFGRRHAASLASLDDDQPLPDSCCTIRDKLDDFLHDRTEGDGRTVCGERTAARYRKTLLCFDAAFHSQPLNTITTAALKAWRNRRRKKVVNGQQIMRDTVNRDIDMLKTFARWAQGQGCAPADLPLLSLKRLWEPGKMPGLNRKPPKYMGMEQLFETIARIGEVRRDVELFLEGMLFFIVRPQALCDLRRRDVSLPVRGGLGRIRLGRIKGMHERYVTIDPGSLGERWARECMAMGARLGPDGPLLVCVGGRSRKNPDGWTTATLGRAIERVREELGLSFTSYMIRHSVIAWAQKQPALSAANVQVAAGHAKITTQEFYKHVESTDGEPVRQAVSDEYGRFKQVGGGYGRVDRGERGV